jgi:hypothetical protein
MKPSSKKQKKHLTWDTFQPIGVQKNDAMKCIYGHFRLQIPPHKKTPKFERFPCEQQIVFLRVA